MSVNYKLKTVESKMIETLERLRYKKFYDKNLSPYTIEHLTEVKDFFEDIEDYESCTIIKTAIENRFSHEENYK